jgi:hypothetical protein
MIDSMDILYHQKIDINLINKQTTNKYWSKTDKSCSCHNQEDTKSTSIYYKRSNNKERADCNVRHQIK